MGDSPEGQRSPGKLDILQERNPKGTRAGCPHVPRDKLAGKKANLTEPRVQFPGWKSGKKKGVCGLWKKEQKTQKDYKDVVRLCNEKMRSDKAQLELNLATVIKDNKKCFYKHISNKRKAKENFPPS